MAALPWQVETLRLTFLNLSHDQAEQDFSWSTITSVAPETVTNKPSLGLITEEGPWLNGSLSVSRQIGRVDIVYSYVPDADQPLPNAGKFVECMSRFEDVFKVASEIKASRVGFGGVLLLPVETGDEGYSYLKRFLPFVSFESDMSEVYFQVNRKKSSPLGLQVNQLSKWSCLALKRMILTDDVLSAGLADLHAVRVEFDINTADQHDKVVVCQMADLLQDLSSRAIFVSENGAL